jgi:hypothetical protein
MDSRDQDSADYRMAFQNSHLEFSLAVSVKCRAKVLERALFIVPARSLDAAPV